MLPWLRALRWTPVWLLSVGFFDEFASGLPSAGAFALSRSFGSDVSELTLAVFVGPALFALLLESWLLVRSEHWPKHVVLGAAVFGMGLSLALGAFSRDVLSFGLSFALYAPSSGVACGVAQSTLMGGSDEEDEASFGQHERNMTDWTLAGYLGDLGTPFLLWGAVALGFDWRAAFGFTALVLTAVSVGLFLDRGLRVPSFGDGQGKGLADNDEQPSTHENDSSLKESLAVLLKNRALLAWLCAVVLCSFMDEILAVMVSLRVANEATVAELLTAFSVGGALGLLGLRRVVNRIPGRRLLALSALGCGLSYAGWLGFETGLAGVMLMFASGLFAAVHYPLAQAQAYRALPARPRLVAAAAQLFAGFDLALPIALGLLADHLGLMVALAALLLQPLGILGICALRTESKAGRFRV